MQVSDTVVEPYNATLSVHQLVENADECMVRSLLAALISTIYSVQLPGLEIFPPSILPYVNSGFSLPGFC